MKSTSTGRNSGAALHMLHRAGQLADEIFAASIGGSDLTPRQFAVLKAVAGSTEPSQTVLVDMTGIDRSTLADIVRRLVERGLLGRKRSSQDARAYIVRLTAGGQKAIKKAEPAARKTDDRLLAALSAGERVTFMKALARIAERDPA